MLWTSSKLKWLHLKTYFVFLFCPSIHTKVAFAFRIHIRISKSLSCHSTANKNNPSHNNGVSPHKHNWVHFNRNVMKPIFCHPHFFSVITYSNDFAWKRVWLTGLRAWIIILCALQSYNEITIVAILLLQKQKRLSEQLKCAFSFTQHRSSLWVRGNRIWV